jgi:hypothetical protein
MPIAPTNLEQQFSSLSTEDRPPTTKTNDELPTDTSNTTATTTTNDESKLMMMTPVKTRRVVVDEERLFSPASVGGGSPEQEQQAVAIVSPDADADNNSNTVIIDNMVVQKTEQKLREERGELMEEPLLKENPQRFVIFPIQDNDVSCFSDESVVVVALVVVLTQGCTSLYME